MVKSIAADQEPAGVVAERTKDYCNALQWNVLERSRSFEVSHFARTWQRSLLLGQITAKTYVESTVTT